MSPQDSQMLHDFLSQLIQARGVQKDPEADAVIQRAVAQQPDAAYVAEWLEVLERDHSHPSIVGWCPFNETWGYYEQTSGTKALSTVYHITKAIDSTRPCIDTSGNFHVVTDIYDIHDYDQNPETFKER